jgi:hypothetical protein
MICTVDCKNILKEITQSIQDAGIMAQRMSPNILKIRFSKKKFMLNRTEPDLTHQWYLT